jgi:hypothetical protein
MEQNNVQTLWKIATYQKLNMGSLVMREERYRLVYPIAVKLNNNEIEVVKAVWEKCKNTSRGVFCTVFYPPDVDAIIHLLVWYDFWRKVEVSCYRRDVEFCNRLRQISEDLWKGRKTPLGPLEFIEALPVRWSL